MSSFDSPNSLRTTITSWLGVTLLTLTFAVSLCIAVRNTLSIERPSKAVIRIAHWQLEAGYRQALQTIIDDYVAQHPGVQIEQIPLPDKVYGPSINTQLISDTAPDICEMGGGSQLVTQDDNTVRYFMPLSTYIVQPNPYNNGTDLENTPWKNTLLDGMRGSFREGLSEYYGVSTTLSEDRIFYNKQLLKAATGSDQPPATFGQWMRMCQQLRQYAAGHDSRILPLVSCMDISSIEQQLQPSFTSSAEPIADRDMDGVITPLETYIAYTEGKVSLQTPAAKAVYETVRSIGDQMQQGFSAIDRQQAQFRFCNGMAAFMWTGSWDASGTAAQTKTFDIGFFTLPLPGPGEPNYQYVHGHAGETVVGGSTYGVCKSSPHRDIALDFLMFWTSRAKNEKFNQLAEWPPLTVGAKPSKLMEPFTPDQRGYNTKLQFDYGPRVKQAISSQIINYYQGDGTYEQFAQAYDRVIRDPSRGGDWAWSGEYDDRCRDVRNKERVLDQQQTLELIDPDHANPDRYRRSLLQQVIRNNGNDYLYLFQQVRGKPMPAF